MSSLRTLDLLVIAIYFVAVAAIGLRFARLQTSTEAYFVARRSVPHWAMGLSVFATIISSITFIAYPGAAFKGDWNQLVPGFMAVGVLLVTLYDARGPDDEGLTVGLRGWLLDDEVASV